MGIRKLYLLAGILLGALLAVSYFVKLEIEEELGSVVKDSLLGILIFHNPLVLAVYIIIILILISIGFNILQYRKI